MTFIDRLADDDAFTPPGSPRPEPHSVGALLSRLGLRTADEKLRRAGIREWLANHQPSEPLVRSLKREGYNDLLPTSAA